MRATRTVTNAHPTHGGLDEATLRRGIEQGDVEVLMSLYATDATIEVVDQTSPPSSPRVLSGGAEIRRYYDDISCRDMAHHLEHVVLSATGAAFLERCEYPGGPRVVVASTLELEEGSIVRQVQVQSWDA